MSDAMGFTQFSIVPVEAWADARLTLECMRVLGALLSFRTRNTDTVWPSREALSERCGGMHVTNVSKATSRLCELGWLEKVGNGGNSRAARYKITVPNLSTVADSATIQTVADSATTPPETVADSATLRVADSARGIEHTTEHTNKGNTQGARGLLAKRGLPNDLAVAWIRVRKEKRLAITEPALDAVEREAAKAGLTFCEAIRVCCEESWGGFKAHWNRSDGSAVSKKQGAPPWWSSDSLILAKGNELGLSARPGESMNDFKGRINAKIALSTGNGVAQSVAG